MKDMRSKQIVVVETKELVTDLVKGYMQEGYGVIQLPDLSGAGDTTAQYLLGIVADEIQEFLKDGEQVVVLRDAESKWIPGLLAKLSKRKLRVTVRPTH